ncbi:MAG: hypothetical protein RLZZ432_1032, partial [Chloroflexota bacterium]
DPDSGYPSWFTTATINKARAAVAALLGGTPPPSIAPTPTPSASIDPKPGAPDVLVDVAPGVATVNWTLPPSGGAADSFEYQLDGSGTWLAAGDSPLTISGLAAGAHTVQIQATNTHGSTLSEVKDFTIVAP